MIGDGVLGVSGAFGVREFVADPEIAIGSLVVHVSQLHQL